MALYIYIYVYTHLEIGTRCDSPGEQGRGHRGAWGLCIRARYSEREFSVSADEGVSIEKFDSAAHAHDAMRSSARPSPLNTRPTIPKYGASERLWSGGIRADSRVIHG